MVILAILAAVSIPALTGFINESNKKAYVAEARTAYVACQAYTTEAMKVEKKTNTAIQTEFANKAVGSATGCPTKFNNYMEGSYTTGATVDSITVGTDGKVTKFVYKPDTTTTVTITPGSGTVVS